MNSKCLVAIILSVLHLLKFTTSSIIKGTELRNETNTEVFIITSSDTNYTSDDSYNLSEHFPCLISYDENGLSVSCQNVDIQELSKHLPLETKTLKICYSSTPILNKPLFPHLKNLESLVLCNNHHRFITSKPFTGLDNLKHLNLSSNDIVVVKRTFIHTPNLEVLDLSYNQIINIKTISDDLTHLRNLTIFILNHNPTIKKIWRDDFTPLSNISLRELHLFNTTIQHVSQEAFQKLKHINKLILSVNYINNEALNNVTIGLSSTAIQYLHLKKLLRLSEFPFEALSFLENSSINKIDMGFNHFPILPQLPSIPSLKELGLSNSFIRQLKPNAFSHLSNLTTLDLSSNQLSSITSSITSADSVKYLLLKNQDVSLFDIKSYAFIKMKNLEQISLTRLNLRGEIHQFMFHGLNNLKMLIISKTQTVLIEDYSFETLESLEALDLRGNSLRELSNFTFYGLTNLQFLGLAYNQIFFTNTYPFLCCPLLKNLYLQHNKIKIIPKRMFLKQYHLERLYLFHNSLTAWNETLFSTNITVEIFHLGGNTITHVSPTMLKDFSFVTKFLDLSGNPFNCSACGTGNFQKFMNNSQLNFTLSTGIPNAEYTCASPKELRGYRLAEVNFTTQHCQEESSDWMFNLSIAIVMATICIFLAVSSWMCYSFRWYLRYWLFHFSSTIKEKRVSTVDTRQYLYDAFISYNSANTGWILEHLMPELEQKEPRLRLCIHERDFEVGRLITENILDAIEASRKVILILSEEFVKSEWCMFELHMAQHKLFDDTRDVLLLLKLTSIDKKLYTKDLLYLEKTRTCFNWTDDPAGQKLFWEKTRKALGLLRIIHSSNEITKL